MTVSDGRTPCSVVSSFTTSHSFVTIPDDEEHVAQNRSCTPERLRA